MPDLSPSETLRAAAARLRELAGAASPGPWTLYDRGVGWEINELPDVHDGTTFRRADAHWIAAMSPAVAEPLASWLDEEAHALEELTPSHVPENALAFARAILEGQP